MAGFRERGGSDRPSGMPFQPIYEHRWNQSGIVIRPPSVVPPWSGRPRHGQLTEAVRELRQPLSEWAIYDRGRLLQEEVNASSEAADQFLRESLGYAKRSLDAAHRSLTQQAKHPKSPPQEAEVREAIRALARESDWLKLFQRAGLAADSTVREAARALARSVDELSHQDAASAAIPDFAALLASIKFLQAEVARAIVAGNGELPRRYLRDLLRTSRRVATETLLAVTAVLVQDGSQGIRPVPGVVFTGLGSAVASAMSALFTAAFRKTRSITPAAQCKQLHHRLITAVHDLSKMLSWLETAPLLPEVKDSLEKLRVGTVFLVSNLDQLAIALLVYGRNGYRILLDVVKQTLVDVQLLITGETDESAADLIARLDDLAVRLGEQSNLIDGL
jgi:hypothetical protein